VLPNPNIISPPSNTIQTEDNNDLLDQLPVAKVPV